MNDIDPKLKKKYLSCRAKFNECCEMERKAFCDKIHQTNPEEFDRILNCTQLAHKELTDVKKEIIKEKTDRKIIPWSSQFSIYLKQNFDEEPEWDNLKCLVALHYSLELNGQSNFLEIATKIVKLSQRDVQKIEGFAIAAAIDFRNLGPS